MQKWQHCKLEGNRVSYLGAAGVFDNKADSHMTERAAWSRLEEAGWQLVSVVADAEGELICFFRRPVMSEEA